MHALPRLLIAVIAGLSGVGALASERPFLNSELIFPLEVWHNHASSVVETPSGDLLVCWFHGSGERTADDVRIEGARQRHGTQQWSERFVMADAPGFPDTNCTLFMDPLGRLWLFWPTILANEWHSALMNYRVSSDYTQEGPPRWERSELLLVKPGDRFGEAMKRYVDEVRGRLDVELPEGVSREQALHYLQRLETRSGDKLYRRLGWMTRAHPFLLGERRLIVPLYSDGFDCSLMAMTDDWGEHWEVSDPLISAANIQPSIVQCRDGSLYTLMRDNGPPPQRLMQSRSFDRGETWTAVTDSELPNPGSGAEIIGLDNGDWVLVSNDTEHGRHRLLVQISPDEGKTWPWRRYLEKDDPGSEAGAYHYPSIIQARDGTLHVTYSYHLAHSNLPKDVDGDPAAKSIKHAHFNVAWVQEGDRSP